MKQTVLNNDYATVYVYSDKKIVHHEIHKFIFGDKFQEMMLAGIDAFEKHRCTKWLSDDRKNSALRKVDTDWGAEVWEPRILKAGWKHWALVLPEKVIGQMNMKGLIERYSGLGVNVKAFTDPQEGMDWLEQQ